MSTIIQINDNNKRYHLRKHLKLEVPRFNTYYMRNSVASRGAIVWNILVPELNDSIDNIKKKVNMAKKSKALQNLDFNCTSPQTLNTIKEDLVTYIRFQAYHITV